jgi:hypothetical protein
MLIDAGSRCRSASQAIDLPSGGGVNLGRFFTPHALAPVADLPVLEMVSAIHILADLTLGLGKVVHDYLRQPSWATPGTKKWLWRLDANLRTKAACDAVRSPQSRIGLEFPV